MAVKNDRKSRAAGGERLESPSLVRRFLLLLAGAVVIVLLAFLVYYQGKEHLFRLNPRFGLGRIEVESQGYWGQNEDSRRQLRSMVSAYMNEHAAQGETVTVFAVNLGELRRYLEAIPSVESAAVERVLPGTLSVRLRERTPRAFINDPTYQMVIDDEGRLMDSRFCLITEKLPVIQSDRRWNLADNGKTEALMPAVALLRAARNNFKNDLKISRVTAVDSESILFDMHFRDGDRLYHVLMKPENFEDNLLKLRDACVQAQGAGLSHDTINMLYSIGVTWQ